MGKAPPKQVRLYDESGGSYTFCVRHFRSLQKFLICASLAQPFNQPLHSQAPEGKPAAVPATPQVAATPRGEKKDEKAELPFQIQLLETYIRFEKNGDSRKEVHTIVRINNILGARQFARLAFDYNGGWQQVEIPMVRVSHANGGTSELLPSAVVEAINPAVEKFSAFQDLREKSVRILGLGEGDTIEYRVITTTFKHPLAPDYWLEHTFDRSGQVLEEDYELDLPGNITSTSRVNARARTSIVFVGVPTTSFERAGEGDSMRSIFRWKIPADRPLPRTGEDEGLLKADVIVTTFGNWEDLSRRIGELYPKWTAADHDTAEKWLRSLKNSTSPPGNKLQGIYEAVSHKLATVDLPIGSLGFRMRPVKDIFDSGYATPNEKCYLLWRMIATEENRTEIVFYAGAHPAEDYPRPSLLHQVFVLLAGEKKPLALDPSSEVAPFGMIAAQFRGKEALSLSPADAGDYLSYWTGIPEDLPFPARQHVTVTSELNSDGSLTSKVAYQLRGDNELLLREAFHATAKEKWKDVAGLLAISDGFRGKITEVNVSDPLATREPFHVEYTITQSRFVDWSKQPVRIPALLPQIGLPDLPARVPAGEQAPKIDLGTPLDVETQMTLKIPPAMTAQLPVGTAVKRDYARFSSSYGITGNTITATRRVNFLLSEIEGERATDYSAFVRAVQTDQAQLIVLEPAAGKTK